ncbi:thioredoxin-like protein [Emericellopsis atlantica]|uniref:Thioredoxin-like protein n=1 Tax=Emericellopsis atlantica TaxID=2614577 RepID=A0A9P7ZLH3_9HYPO|nr:thioredoxin-like protein [Emericellopsis atlantica]KAG9253683.1 thioredoxin-like protein [Emericellopsis atlantica]
MPSPRRMRLILLAGLSTVILIFFYTSRLSDDAMSKEHTPFRDFYQKTKHAMDAGSSSAQQLHPADRDKDGDIDEDDRALGAEMQTRLKEAELRAKKIANQKGGLKPDPPSNVVGVGSSADGQDGAGGSSGEQVEEVRDAEAELNMILKKSPTIIFSKTFCPHSKRAKKLLLERYTISPEPYIVELDEHPMGPALQDALEVKTGRRTVPNVLINGVSIGGADDVYELDGQGLLIDKIIEFGSKRVDVARSPSI